MSTTNENHKPYIGLAVHKIKGPLGDHTLPDLIPEDLTVTIKKDDGKVRVEIEHKLKEVEMVEEIKKIQDAVEKGDKAFLGFKKNSFHNGEYEIETKKVPKLVLRKPRSFMKDDQSLVLTPTIENNDRTVKVNSSFMIPGYKESGPNLKLQIAQKILGDYIVDGIDVDTFKVTVAGTESSPIIVKLSFDLFKVQEIYDQTSSVSSLSEDELMQYVSFNEPKSDVEYLINPKLNNEIFSDKTQDNSHEYVNVQFSYSLLDGFVDGLADGPKKPGTSGLSFDVN
jgi:hypothetical protein